MKKGSLMTVLCLAIVLGVTGCGKEQTEGDAGAKTSDADAKSGSVSAADYDIDKYVTFIARGTIINSLLVDPFCNLFIFLFQLTTHFLKI